jgi:hypothetical protein
VATRAALVRPGSLTTRASLLTVEEPPYVNRYAVTGDGDEVIAVYEQLRKLLNHNARLDVIDGHPIRAGE